MGYSLRGFLRQAITAGGTHPYPAAMGVALRHRRTRSSEQVPRTKPQPVLRELAYGSGLTRNYELIDNPHPVHVPPPHISYR